MSNGVIFDPILNRLRRRESDSSSTSGGWDDAYSVGTYADLPPYQDHQGEYWMVDQQTKEGAWYNPFKQTYLAGIYKALAGGWDYRGVDVDEIPKEYDYYVTPNDWADLVQALESGAYQSVFIPNPTTSYLCTDNEPTPINVHANVLRIDGESREGCIIDADCANNNLIENFIVLPHPNISLNNFTIKNYGVIDYKSAIYYIGGTDTRPLVYNVKIQNFLIKKALGVTQCNNYNCTFINDSDTGYGTGTYLGELANSFGQYIDQLGNGNYVTRGNYARSCYFGFNGCKITTMNTAQSCAIGIYYCSSVALNSVRSCTITGIRNCTDVGLNSFVSNNVDISDSTFNHTERDNTDNTKQLTLDYSKITTGTERTQSYQDLDGDIAVLTDGVAGGSMLGLDIYASEPTAPANENNLYAYFQDANTVVLCISDGTSVYKVEATK